VACAQQVLRLLRTGVHPQNRSPPTKRLDQHFTWKGALSRTAVAKIDHPPTQQQNHAVEEPEGCNLYTSLLRTFSITYCMAYQLGNASATKHQLTCSKDCCMFPDTHAHTPSLMQRTIGGG
jgi:hypothetical protein